MSTSSSRTSSLGSSSPRSSSPVGLAQPDHFYGADPSQPHQPSAFKAWLTPEDDPFAHRGIPVFKPSMEEFKDFEGYMTRVEAWGARSGIIKIIPPQEWTSALPSVKAPLQQVKIKSPIEQHMLGRGGLFRQENVEKRKFMSVREWAELCQKEDFRAPGVDEVGRHARAAIVPKKPKRGKKNTDDGTKRSSASTGGRDQDAVTIKQEVDDVSQADSLHEPTDVHSITASTMATPEVGTSSSSKQTNKQRPRRQGQTREAREATLADKAARDLQFVEAFDPHQDWLPPNTKASDYTPDFCHSLERHYWRNCGLAKPAWYGADSQGSLFTDETKHWNVAHLDSALSRLLPASDHGLPGVNTPYLYFGMWRATFAWHVEDMDLFSINYIHFGAPKFWYAVPQGRADALERIMREYFPKDTSQCPQFLRHKSFLASPTLLAQSACRPNHLVQHAGEIVITFPRGYHAGFNLGFNCAESVNFALDSWLEMGKQAKVCECVSDSVRIDVTQLLLDRALEAAAAAPPLPKLKLKKPSSKRKATSDHPPAKTKKVKTEPTTLSLGPEPAPIAASTNQPAKKLHITLKLGPKPVGAESYPCCLCASTNEEGLLRVHAPPLGKREAVEAAHDPKVWRAHELCASVIPETWVDEMDSEDGLKTERVVYGVDAIVKDRWNLKCSACTKTRDKVHGAPIQCTKGKCPKAFHVSCAKDGAMHGIVFEIVKDVEKEVVLVGPDPSATSMTDPLSFSQMAVDHGPPPDVLKIIKKVEVQALCPQHNPTLAAAKKANKQDRIKNDLLALPTMARIKIRVSAGVFEVSLIRVIEETGSVEVLWDRGLKREFKWGSVVFGSTDGPIQQKPSEIAVVPQASTSVLPVVTYPSISAATSASPILQLSPPPPPANAPQAPVASTSGSSSASSSALPATMPATPYYTVVQRPAAQYDYWPKQGAYSAYPVSYTAPYVYATAAGGVYQAYTPGTAAYNPYLYPRQEILKPGTAQLQWQQPYNGPPATAPATASSTSSSSRVSAVAESSVPHPTSPSSSTTSTTNDVPTTAPEPAVLKELAQTTMLDLSALSKLSETQVADILRANPALADLVAATFARHKTLPTSTSS